MIAMVSPGLGQGLDANLTAVAGGVRVKGSHQRVAGRRRVLAAVVAVAAMAVVLPVGPRAAATDNALSAFGIDTSTRKSVYDSYQQALKPALATPLGWTGNPATCIAGTVSPAATAASLDAVNWFREIAGLGPVTFDATLSAQAQQAALMMYANSQLSHFPTPDWDCYTDVGADAAGSSNLALGGGTAAGANAVALYMRDPGSSNTEVGHRRWVLFPPRTTMGNGFTCCSDALYVFGQTSASQPSPEWVPWPTAGYFPVQLEPGGRWSLSSDDQWDTDFSNATVTVTQGAQTIPVQTVHDEVDGYGNDTLVWQFTPGYSTGQPDRPYTVAVDGIVKNGVPTSHQYTVTLFDGEIDADQTISFGALGAKTYGDASFSVSATATSGLPVSFTSTTSTVCTASGTNGRTVTILRAGTCTIRADQAGDAIRHAAPAVSRSLTVNKRDLTVRADDQTRLPGSANPTLTSTIAGFVNGETLSTSGITGSPSCSTTATTTSPVGTYPITCSVGSLSSTKYSFSFAPGTLAVKQGGVFTAVSPKRLLDSRDGTGGINTKWGPGATRDLTVAGGTTGIPADATAVVLNVTVTQPTTDSFLTVFPNGAGKPEASNLNYSAGQTIPNAVTVKVGPGGQISLYNNAGTTHVIADIVGYYRDTGSGGVFTGVTPNRLLDSRDGTGGINTKWGTATTRDLTVAGGTTGIPADTTAVVLNVTVTQPTTDSFLTVFPSGTARPEASNLNYSAGQTIPNAVTVKVGPGGQISLYNNAGTTHVIADIVGYYRDTGSGGVFTGVVPSRLLDSRDGTGGFTTKWGTATTRNLTVADGTVIPADATAVVLNVTVTQPTSDSFLTVFPSGTARPDASNLNYSGGQTIPNAVTVKVGPGGLISLYNNAGTTHVIADVVGYYR
jgi:hypothetical protein